VSEKSYFSRERIFFGGALSQECVAMHRALACLLTGVFWLAAPIAGAVCCQLVKVEPQPAATQVRVCDAATNCSQAIFEGNVGYGSPVAICTSSAGVNYRELDPATGSYGASTHARCESSTNVEL
jgi:hypothetical protein